MDLHSWTRENQVNLLKQHLAPLSPKSADDALSKQDADGRTPLHLTTDPSTLSLLLSFLPPSARAPHVADEAGWLPLHSLCSSGSLESLRILLASPAFADEQGEVQRSLDATNAQGNTGLMYAVSKSQPGCVSHLLALGTDPSLRNLAGQTVLFAPSVLCFILIGRR